MEQIEQRGAEGPAASADAQESNSADPDDPYRSPDPNNPSEYCSTIPPMEQAQAALSRPPLTVMVPVGVLKRGDKPRGEPKQVKFSDGIRPGGDLTESDGESQPLLPRRQGRTQLKLKSPPAEKASLTAMGKSGGRRSARITINDVNGPLPPIISIPEFSVEEPDGKPTISNLFHWLLDETVPQVTFCLTKNLYVIAKLVERKLKV